MSELCVHEKRLIRLSPHPPLIMYYFHSTLNRKIYEVEGNISSKYIAVGVSSKGRSNKRCQVILDLESLFSEFLELNHSPSPLYLLPFLILTWFATTHVIFLFLQKVELTLKKSDLYISEFGKKALNSTSNVVVFGQ